MEIQVIGGEGLQPVREAVRNGVVFGCQSREHATRNVRIGPKACEVEGSLGAAVRECDDGGLERLGCDRMIVRGHLGDHGADGVVLERGIGSGSRVRRVGCGRSEDGSGAAGVDVDGHSRGREGVVGTSGREHHGTGGHRCNGVDHVVQRGFPPKGLGRHRVARAGAAYE